MSEKNQTTTQHKPGLASLTIQRYFADRAKERPVIFITGCGRSGTTLALRCLATLQAKNFYPSELSLVRVFKDNLDKEAVTVAKRTHLCHQSFDYMPSDILILHAVRHPRQVITSRHPDKDGFYHDAQRWIAEYTQYETLKARHPAKNLLVLRHEDVLSAPNQEQARIAKAWDLDFDQSFSQYHTLSDSYPTFHKVTGEQHKWDPIDPERAISNRSDIKSELTERFEEMRPQLEPHLSRFCHEFGYDLK